MSKHPILWQSPETNQNGDPFFTVRKANGYYIYGERAGIDSVAFILYNKITNMYGIIYEPKPPLEQDIFRLTAFGGSLDKDLPLNEIVQEEVQEEAGYTVSLGRITPLGKVFVSTQMNQHCHLFVVDITGLVVGARYLEEHEHGSTVQWRTAQTIHRLEDWKASLIVHRH